MARWFWKQRLLFSMKINHLCLSRLSLLHCFGYTVMLLLQGALITNGSKWLRYWTKLAKPRLHKTWRKRDAMETEEEGANEFQVAPNHSNDHWAKSLPHCGREHCNSHSNIRTEKEASCCQGPRSLCGIIMWISKGTSFSNKSKHN